MSVTIKCLDNPLNFKLEHKQDIDKRKHLTKFQENPTL